MRIGVVGDIHSSYSQLKQAFREMGKVDLLFFTGDGYRDISRLQQESALQVVGVVGNCDFYSEFPSEQILQIEDYKILLTHGHLYSAKTGLQSLGMAGRAKEVQLVVFGHTHEPVSTDWYEIKLFNPGALSLERSQRGPSYGLIEITKSGMNCTIHYLD